MDNGYSFEYEELFAKLRLARKALDEFRAIYNDAIDFNSGKSKLKSEIAFDVLEDVLDDTNKAIDESLWDDIKRVMSQKTHSVLEESGWDI